jgi:hypothetical protein
MRTTLLLTGIACVITAVVGGGFRGLGVELPHVASVRRQVILGLVGVCLLIAGGRTTESTPDDPRDTGGSVTTESALSAGVLELLVEQNTPAIDSRGRLVQDIGYSNTGQLEPYLRRGSPTPVSRLVKEEWCVDHNDEWMSLAFFRGTSGQWTDTIGGQSAKQVAHRLGYFRYSGWTIVETGIDHCPTRMDVTLTVTARDHDILISLRDAPTGRYLKVWRVE